jgi:hypothetical protein
VHREQILHLETFKDRDGCLDHTKTFVNFKNPSPSADKHVFATVDMPVDVFYEELIKPAYEGTNSTR